MDKFKVGDKVKLVRINREGPWYKKYLGNVYTIKDFETDNYGRFAIFKETSDVMPYVKNLELVKEEYTYEDLKKSPIGTKITFGNGNMFMKYTEDKFINLSAIRSIEWLSNLRDNFGQLGKIIKIEEPTYKTVYEHKEEILDEAEKRYLRGVIRPFRKEIKYIMKSVSNIDGNLCYIRIIIDDFDDSSTLPYFNGDKMYKGMMTEKKYTLKELGL